MWGSERNRRRLEVGVEIVLLSKHANTHSRKSDRAHIAAVKLVWYFWGNVFVGGSTIFPHGQLCIFTPSPPRRLSFLYLCLSVYLTVGRNMSKTLHFNNISDCSSRTLDNLSFAIFQALFFVTLLHKYIFSWNYTSTDTIQSADQGDFFSYATLHLVVNKIKNNPVQDVRDCLHVFWCSCGGRYLF